MKWTKLAFSNSRINKAGETLVSSESSDVVSQAAMQILTNWRSSHSFPLHIFAVRLKGISKRIDPAAITTRRLKRVSSILNKLKRDQTRKMQMSRMQDVGGCRTVLSNISKVNEVVKSYAKRGGIKHKLHTQKDYIQNPKKDGYRSYHLVYKYYSDKNKDYDGLLIEIQIRTSLQHYWATAVETVDHFTKQAIKSNEGEKEWMEFFRLVSSAFARMEKTPIVPNTPIDSNELKTKIRYYAKKLDVINKMNEWTKIHKIIENFERDIEAKKDKIDYYLLNLDLVTKELSITPYKKNEDQLANAEYSRLEQKMIEANEERDIVLVSADTTRELRKGYPNYFMDSKQFLNKLNQYIKDED